MKPTGGTLVIGPAWVGDMVMAQSLFKTLKEREPGQPIDVVAPAWSLPLLDRMSEVRGGIELPLEHGELRVSTRLRIGWSLRERHYDKAIVLPRSLKSALVPWAAGIPRRIGYRGEMRYGLINDIRLLDKSVLKQTVQRYAALGLEGDAPLPPKIHNPRLLVNEDNRGRLVESLGLSLKTPVVALLPGAEYGPAKQWPIEHFATLARELERAGAHCWIFGSQKDHRLGEAIADNGGGSVHNLCGRTRLGDAVDLLSLASLAVTNDSGLMHVAAAASIPVIAIYGSSSPDFTPPLSGRSEIVYLALECSPCFDRVCRLGHANCLKNITPEQILVHAKHYIQ